jgi:hypothetical protein
MELIKGRVQIQNSQKVHFMLEFLQSCQKIQKILPFSDCPSKPEIPLPSLWHHGY